MEEESSSRQKTSRIYQKKRKQYFGETEGRKVKKLKQETEYREKIKIMTMMTEKKWWYYEWEKNNDIKYDGAGLKRVVCIR